MLVVQDAPPLHLGQLAEAPLRFVIRDIALRWWADKHRGDGPSQPEALEGYRLPLPHGGVFTADLVIRNLRTRKLWAAILIASRHETAAEVRERLAPYITFVTAAPHVFNEMPDLAVFLPEHLHGPRPDLAWLPLGPPPVTVFTY